MIETKLQGLINILAVLRLGGGGRGDFVIKGELGHVLYCTSTHEMGMLDTPPYLRKVSSPSRTYTGSPHPLPPPLMKCGTGYIFKGHIIYEFGNFGFITKNRFLISPH